MGKGNITKFKRVGKHQFVKKQNLKKKEKIPTKEKKVNQERQGHISRKRIKLQDDNSNEEMIIKNQRPEIKS